MKELKKFRGHPGPTPFILMITPMVFSLTRLYTNIYNAIEKWESDHRETEIFQQLAVSELFNQLNK